MCGSLFRAAQYEWDSVSKTDHIQVAGARAERDRKPNTTSGVRGVRGFTRGTHKFLITVESKGGWGSFAQIGVCDSKADMFLDCGFKIAFCY